MSFNRHQLKKLATPLDVSRIKIREREGRALSYLEGWFVIAEANRIFGYDGWDREMVHFERLFTRKSSEGYECGYLARVRLCVRAETTAVVREGTGFGRALAATVGEAYERALKAAETDATKRALVTFGSRFGLLLYDKEQRDTAQMSRVSGNDLTRPDEERCNGAFGPSPTQTKPNPRPLRDAGYRLITSEGDVISTASAESFCTGLEQLLAAAQTRNDVVRLRWNNRPTMNELRLLPQLVGPKGQHHVQVLEQLLVKRLNEFSAGNRNSTSTGHEYDEGMAVGAPATVSTASVIPVAVTPPELTKPFVPVPNYPIAKFRKLLTGTNEAKVACADTKPASPSGPPTTGIVGSGEPSRSEQPHALTRRSQISGGYSIDKNALAYPSERRLRSRAHRVYVASKPCLLCQAQPCHAHHITFAQPRGLSQKVSDEFTVPLCVQHHNELHAFGNEASWWRSQGVEPLPVANALWCESAKGEPST